MPLGGLGGGLLASAALIAVVTALSRVVGFGRWVTFSATVHAQCVGQAYSAANQLPTVLFEVVAGGALAGVVVPLLAGPLSRAGAADGRQEIDAIASALLGWTLVVLLPAAAVLAALAGPVSGALITQTCPGQRDLVARLIVLFAPQIPLYGIGVVLGGVLLAHRRFLAAALAPLLSSLVVIGAYVAFGATAAGSQDAADRVPGVALAWLAGGTTAGVAVLTLPLLVPVHRAGVRLRPALRLPPGVARRGRALAAAGVGALLAQQAAVLAVVVLTGRSGDSGSLPVFQYAQAVYLLPYAVLAVPLATAAFPRLAAGAAAGDREGFAGTAAAGTRAVVLAALLGTAALVAVAGPVTRFFAALDRGDVGRLDPALTALAPGLVGFALIAHAGRALYALERGRAAALATGSGWVVVVVASVLAVRAGAPVVTSLAWANTAGMAVAGILLVVALRAAAGPPAVAGLPRALGAGVLAAGLAGPAGRLAAAWVDGAGPAGSVRPAGAGGAVLAGVVAAAVTVAVFAAAVAILDRPDARALVAPVRGRGVARNRPAAGQP